MSIEISNEVWKYADLSQGELLVALALADNADTETRQAYPGIEYLAWKARYSERQVMRCLKSLAQKGMVLASKHASPNGTNLYVFAPVSEWNQRGDILSPARQRQVTSETESGDICDIKQVTPMSPKPSEEPSEETSESTRMRASDLFSDSDLPEQAPEVDCFEIAWKHYPHHPSRRNKKAARAKFSRIVSGKEKDLERYPSAEELAQAAVAYALSKPDPEYVPAMDGWLNRSKWLAFIGKPAKRENQFTRMMELDRAAEERAKRQWEALQS